MDGITILNEIIIDNTDEAIAGIVLSGLMIVMTIIGLILGFKILKDGDSPIVMLGTIAILLALFIGIAALPNSISRLSDLPIVQYEVTISDDVSFTEFTEKYDIIEQRGEIYVVQEKETQED